MLEPEEERGFAVCVPAIPEIVTYGEDEPEALAMAEDAIRPLSADGQYAVCFGAHQIATIDLTEPKSVGHVSEQVSVMSPK